MARRRARTSIFVAPPRVEPSDPVERLLVSARRSRRRGEQRRELTVLREAALLVEHDARVHAMLGAAATRAGRLDEAARALRHARWLRARAGEEGRAAALAGILEQLARAGL